MPCWAQNSSSWGEPGDDFLLTGAKIMVAPGETLNKANLHIKNGRVEAVGAGVTGSSRSRKIDCSDLVIHPGFLDPYVQGGKVGLKKKDRERSTPVSGQHPRVHDDFRIVDALDLKEGALDKYRKLGFVAVAVAPEGAIFGGQSAVYLTGESANDADLLLKSSAYSTLGFETLGWSKLKGENYPLSIMGCMALIRQTFLDLDWYQKKRVESVDRRPDYSGNLESLAAVKAGDRLLLGESDSYLDVLRLLDLFRELGIRRNAVLLSGQEWKQLSWLKQKADPRTKWIAPLSFPETPELKNGLKRSQLTLDLLRDWYYAPANPRFLNQAGLRFSYTTHGLKSLNDFPKRVQETVEAGLSEKDALAALTTEPAAILGLSEQMGTLKPGKSASFVVREGGPFSGETALREVWIGGKRFPDYAALAEGESPQKKSVKVRDFVKEATYKNPPTLFPSTYAPGSVLVKNATLWTQSGGASQLGDFLVRNGKIAGVGQATGGASVEIDGSGLHITPGIVDAHSHTAIQGMVNEPGANITAMVHMKDVLNPFDYNIYLQLASGVTTVNVLHGSANAIGGKAVTCKWKLGTPPEGLIFEGAPEGIKFALGENPKQSNWGDEHATRYPQSRMGVVELIRGAFLSARNYRKLQQAGKEPKPDLMLEALLEVIDGKRIVHCHSYRQDEILALIRVAEEVGFKVNVFQHVLEGYKVADQIAKHGAAASTFADWWAYKVEVEDAIPHNAALLHKAGVLTSVNSDSNDLARRLNTEAAKSMRYGDMTEPDALNLITRNAAEQLGVLNRIGTLELGKDADFVIWSDHPLTQQAIVLETWVDGVRQFKRSEEEDRVAKLEAERERLLKLWEGKDDE